MFKILDASEEDLKRTPTGRPKVVREGSPAYNELVNSGYIPNENLRLLIKPKPYVRRQRQEEPGPPPIQLPQLTELEYREIMCEFGLYPGRINGINNIINDFNWQLEEERVKDKFEELNRRDVRNQYELVKETPSMFIFKIRNCNEISEHTLQQFIGERPNYRMAFYHEGQVKLAEDILYSPNALNGFIHGVIVKIYELNTVTIVLAKNNGAECDFNLAENPNLNCVLAAILQEVPKKAAVINKLSNEFKRKNITRVNKELARIIAKKTRVRLIFKDQLTNDWFNTDPENKNKRQSITLFAHNNHATLYKPPNFTITDVSYCTPENIREIFDNQHGVKRTFVKTDGVNHTIQAFIHSGCMYKTYRPPSTDPIYYSCINELSFEYKKWVVSKDVKPPQGLFYDVLRLADHHLTTQQFKNYQSTDYFHHHDMVKAFPSFMYSPLYEQYQFPDIDFNLFRVDIDDLSILSHTGFVVVEDVVYHNEVIEAIKWIQSGCIYTTMRIHTAITNGWISCRLSYLITCSKRDYQIPLANLHYAFNKSFNVKFIGRMIVGGHGQETQEYYYTKDENEMAQMLYECDRDGLQSVPDHDNGLLTVIKKQTSKKALWHIHSYILDYQQCTFMKALTAIGLDTMVAFNVDGVYTDKIVKLPPDITGDAPGKIISGGKSIGNLSSTWEATEHTTVDLGLFNPPPLSVWLGRTNGAVVIGPAGCGKSHDFFNTPLVDSVICTPTLLLKHNHRQRTQLPVMTLHKFFGIGVPYHKQSRYSNVMVDEFTMITKQIMERIVSTCKEYKMNLYLVGDMTSVGIMQLSPPQCHGDSLEWEYISRMNVYEKPVDGNRCRQRDPNQRAIIDSLRGLSYEKQIDILMETFPDNFIGIRQAVEMYDKTAIGISFKHSRCNLFNQMILKKDPDWLKAKCVSKKGGVKGQIVTMDNNENNRRLIWFNRKKSDEKTPNGCVYELSYMATCDAVQGGSYDGNIFVDLNSASRRDNLLYTSVSRCTDLTKVYYINE